MNFIPAPAEKSSLKNYKRFRFLECTFSAGLSFDELLLFEKKLSETPLMLLDSTLFFNKDFSKVYFPITGAKSTHYQFLNSHFVDFRFNELESLTTNFNFWANESHSVDGIMFQINAFLAKNSSFQQKNMLVELNSKDLALHFFI